jgi:hypothetical protein
VSSRWNLIRRRVIGPVMFLGGIGLLARQTCQKTERTHATIVVELGASASRVRSIDADLLIGGELISNFHRKALQGMTLGPVRFETAMPAQDGELQIDVELDGTHRKLVRHIHAEEGSTITVPLASDLP